MSQQKEWQFSQVLRVSGIFLKSKSQVCQIQESFAGD